MSELEGFVGSNLEIRGWLTRNVFGHFALFQVKCSFPFKIIHIAGDHTHSWGFTFLDDLESHTISEFYSDDTGYINSNIIAS